MPIILRQASGSSSDSSQSVTEAAAMSLSFNCVRGRARLHQLWYHCSKTLGAWPRIQNGRGTFSNSRFDAVLESRSQFLGGFPISQAMVLYYRMSK